MTYQGRSTPANPLLPTDRQMPFIGDLLLKHEIPDEPRPGHDEDALMLERVMDVLGKKQIWRHEASALIDWLQTLPLKPGVQPARTATQGRRQAYPARRWPARPSKFTPSAPPATQRSHKDIAAEALAVARQLAAQPGVKERMRLVGQISDLEQELGKGESHGPLQ